MNHCILSIVRINMEIIACSRYLLGTAVLEGTCYHYYLQADHLTESGIPLLRCKVVLSLATDLIAAFVDVNPF